MIHALNQILFRLALNQFKFILLVFGSYLLMFWRNLDKIETVQIRVLQITDNNAVITNEKYQNGESNMADYKDCFNC